MTPHTKGCSVHDVCVVCFCLCEQEYSQAYDNLVEALRQGKPVGDYVEAIGDGETEREKWNSPHLWTHCASVCVCGLGVCAERGLPDGARDAIRRRQDMRQITAP